MWFKKKQTSTRPAPYPGVQQPLDGHSALAEMESRTSDSLVVRAAPYFDDLNDLLRKAAAADQNLTVQQTADPGELAAMLTGVNLTGLRSAAITGRITGIADELYALAGNRLSCVINLTCRALARQSGSLNGGHDEYHAIAGAGLFQLFAANVQEVADFNVIAHRVAELALTPGVCAQDLYRTSHAVQNILLPETELLQKFLGNAADEIETPTPAQALLFGARRRRIPILLDPDRPAGIGAIQDQESYFRAVAAQRPFFYDHLNPIINGVLSEYADLTGRAYAPVTGYHIDDAEIVIIAQGAVVEELQAAVDHLRNKEKIRAGLVKLSMLRPFPGAQLSHLLHGKKAVTVLERTDQPLAEDLPLTQEVRSVLDKSLENGRSAGKLLPYPDYKSFHQISDRPLIYTGVYGIGTELPDTDDLVAVYRNMLSGNRSKKCFYVGRIFTQPDRRFPHLQTLRQKLDKAYPELEQLSVAGTAEQTLAVTAEESADIHYLSGQGGLFAVNLLARAVSKTLPGQVRTFPQGGLEQNLQPASITICSSTDHTVNNRPAVHDVVLVASYELVDDQNLPDSIKPGGNLIIASNRPPEALRHDLSRRIQQLIRERDIHVQVINARKIAVETAANPALIDQLTVWALLGVYLAIKPGLRENDMNNIRTTLQAQLGELLGAGHVRTSGIMQALARAPEERVELPQEFWHYQEKSEPPEPEPPWTVKQVAPDQHVFDTSRFWHSVGYLYDSGQADHALTDPYLATGLIPAASSAFRDISPYRLRLPEWQPDNCTGCGICWATCPETALPPLVQDLPSLIQGAVARCEVGGVTLVQMKRIQDAVAKQAYKLLAKDDLQQYLEMGKLLQDAFDQTMIQMKVEGEKRDAMAGEFSHVHMQLAQLKLARTQPFFVDQHLREKNTGMVLSINLNPMTCTGCGICVEACPDQALTWGGQSAEQLDILKQNWKLQLDLPQLSPEKIDAFISADNADSYVNQMLDRNAYHSMLGGDGSRPGNGARTAIHLLTATAESIMQRRFAQHIARLEQLVNGLQAAIQGDVTGTLNINDFDDFTRRLSSLDGSELSPDKLAGLVRDKHRSPALDEVKLRRQGELLGKLKQQLQLYKEGSAGKGRARMLLAVDPGIPSWWSDTYPYNPHTQPWICYTAGHLTVLAEGLLSGIRHTLTNELSLCRLTELELSGSYSDEAVARITAEFNWRTFTDSEQVIIPPVFIVSRAGADIQQDIQRLLADNYPVKLVVINQQGFTVPDPNEPRRTPGNFSYYTEMLALAQKDVLIIQTSIGQPGDLIRAIGDVVRHDGPALLHIYAPDPGISGIAQDKIIEQAALAYRSRAFPLFRMQRQDNTARLILDANPDPLQDWYSREATVRAVSGQEQKLLCRLTPADWAVREARFQQHFELLPKGHLHEGMLPLTDYLELGTGQKDQYQPYIDYVNDKQQHLIATVSPAMASACETARNHWRKLQSLTTRLEKPAALREGALEPATVPEQAAAAADVDAYQQLTLRLLELCGYSQDPDFFKQSLRQFIVPDEQQQPEATD